jgi:hypothetical protein
MKIIKYPVPQGIPASIGTIQCTFALAVHAFNIALISKGGTRADDSGRQKKDVTYQPKQGDHPKRPCETGQGQPSIFLTLSPGLSGLFCFLEHGVPVKEDATGYHPSDGN